MRTRFSPLRRIGGLLAIAATTVTLLVGTGGPAAAATKWSRSITGASGYGDYTRSAQTYRIWYVIKDTRADGDCAYVVLRPQVYYAYTETWLSVGLTGYEVRHNICGVDNSLSGYDNIDVWARMSALDRTAGSAIRMYIKVCRNVDNATDPCSSMVTPSVSL